MACVAQNIFALSQSSTAQKYLDLSHLQIVAVGDAAKIRETLAKYGTVDVY